MYKQAQFESLDSSVISGHNADSIDSSVSNYGQADNYKLLRMQNKQQQQQFIADKNSKVVVDDKENALPAANQPRSRQYAGHSAGAQFSPLQYNTSKRSVLQGDQNRSNSREKGESTIKNKVGKKNSGQSPDKSSLEGLVRLKEENSCNMQEMNRMRTLLTELEAKLRKMHKDKDRQQGVLKQTQDELNKLKRAQTNSSGEGEVYQLAIGKLRTINAELQIQLLTTRQKVEALTKENCELSAAVTKRQQSVEQCVEYQQRLNQFMTKLNESQARYNQLQVKFFKIQKDNDANRTAREEAEGIARQQTRMLAEEKGAREVIQDNYKLKIQELESFLKNMEKQQSNMTVQKDLAINKVEKELRGQILRLKAQLEASQDQIEKKSKEFVLLQEEKDNQFRAYASDCSNSISNMKQEKETMMIRLQQSAGLVASLQAKIAELESREQALRYRVIEYETQVKQSKEFLSEATQELTRLRSKHEILNAQYLNYIQTSKDQTLSITTRLTKEIQHKNSQIHTLEQVLHQKKSLEETLRLSCDLQERKTAAEHSQKNMLVEGLRKQIAELHSNIALYQRLLKNKQDEAAGALRELEFRQAQQILKLNNLNTTLQNQLDSRERTIGNLRAQFTETQSQSQLMSFQMTQLKRTLTEELCTLKGELQRTTEEYQQLQKNNEATAISEIHTLQDQKHAIQKHTIELRKQINELNILLKEREFEISDLKQSEFNLKGNLAFLEAEIISKDSALLRYAKEMEAIRIDLEKIPSLIDQRNRFNFEREQLVKERQNHVSQIQTLNKETSVLKQKIHSLETEAAKKYSQLITMEQQNHTITQKVAETQQNYSKLQAQNSQLKAALANLSAQMPYLLSVVQEKTKAIKVLQSTLEHKTQHINQCTRIIATKDKQLYQSQERHQLQLLREVARKDRQINKIGTQEVHLRNQIDRYAREYESLRTKYQQQTKKRIDEKQIIRRQADELRLKLGILETQNRNLTLIMNQEIDKRNQIISSLISQHRAQN